MTTMVAVDHAVTWTEWDERTRSYVHKVLTQGNEADIPDEVVARFEKMPEKKYENQYINTNPRVLSPEDYAAWTDTKFIERDPILSITDEQLKAMPAETLMAKMNILTGLAPRVLDLEKRRNPQRKPIIAHAERLLEASSGGNVSLVDAPESPTQVPGAAV
jgi:hypothetical protein